jgi:tRNA uridine 5-carboxymethylaminomethyl modification enzyme
MGLVRDERWSEYQRKQVQIVAVRSALEGHRNGQWLKSPENSIRKLGEWIRGVLDGPVIRGVLETVETEVKYSGYISQQERQIDRLRAAERRPIPTDFVYRGIAGLSREIWEKLEHVRPETLGQAARIPGVTPAAIAILDVYMSLTRVS